MRRRLLALLPVAALGATAALLVPAGAAGAAPPAATAGKTYVSLGDSYAAGYGLPLPSTPTGKPVAGCDQTTGDYPHLLAASLGLTLTDVTCSGATTDDFSAPQDVTGPKPPAQLDVFKTVQPDLVTVTIGGNDLGFTSIATTCLAATPNGNLLAHPTFASCKQYFGTPAGQGGGQADDPYAKLAGVLAKVDAALKAVRAAAPNAAIAVIAYPAIAPDLANTPTTGCFTAPLPFTTVDLPYLQALQQQLDDGIGRVATANGAGYADIYPSSLAHSACSPESTRWVEPVVPAGGGSNVLHPSLAGTTAMAAALAPVVTALLAPPATSSPTPTAPSTGSTPAGGGTTVVAGAPGLADTGVDVPVPWLLGLAAALVVVGGVTLRTTRRPLGRH